MINVKESVSHARQRSSSLFDDDKYDITPRCETIAMPKAAKPREIFNTPSFLSRQVGRAESSNYLNAALRLNGERISRGKSSR